MDKRHCYDWVIDVAQRFFCTGETRVGRDGEEKPVIKACKLRALKLTAVPNSLRLLPANLRLTVLRRHGKIRYTLSAVPEAYNPLRRETEVIGNKYKRVESMDRARAVNWLRNNVDPNRAEEILYNLETL